MRYLSIFEILELHKRTIASSGGASGIRDLGALESCVNQPHASFGNRDLYPSIAAKAGSLCFSLVMNHPFLDGNKRIGHAAMETFLMLNEFEIDANVDEQADVILTMASGDLTRDSFINWLKERTIGWPVTDH